MRGRRSNRKMARGMEVTILEQEKIILRGRTVIGGFAQGEALVSVIPLMGWGNLDQRNGIILERNHPLYGVSIKGKVLVFSEPRGSGGFNRFGRTRQFGSNPVAFLYRSQLPMTVLASMEMQVPSMTDFDRDPTSVIHTGDWVIVNADTGIVEIHKNNQNGRT